VYSTLPAKAYFAAVKEAKELGLPVAGHLPYDVAAAQASDAGQHTIEHLEGVAAMCSPLEKRCVAKLQNFAAGKAADPHTPWKVELEALETFDPKLAFVLLHKFVENGTWHVPTLTQARGLARLDDPKAVDPKMEEKLPPLVRFLWKRAIEKDGVRLPNNKRWYSWDDLKGRRALLEAEIKLVGRMHAAGVPLLAGTDTPSPLVVPGESLHDELDLFVKAGLPTAEALRTATLNPAKCLKLEQDTGAIEVGRCADLVLLGGDPLVDIRNARRVEAVWVSGRKAGW
jgi:imidazolonepropionase-like amidohydrolase